MRHLIKLVIYLWIGVAYASINQTDDVSPIYPETALPFRISIEQANFQLPVGVQSGVIGLYRGLWILIAGRKNGVHGFDFTDNFPISDQSATIYVVNPSTGAVASRSLLDPSAGLNQQQIDSLSVVSAEFYQDGITLYMVGGYGFDTSVGDYITQSTLTAFNLPGVVAWVTQPENTSYSLLNSMQQISNPIFSITGGKLLKLGNVMQLIFGQTMTGPETLLTNGDYSEQVREFELKQVNGQLEVEVLPSQPLTPDPNFRRRDLNVVPALFSQGNALEYGFIAYSGVFTTNGGIWTVPVIMQGTSNPVMPDSSLSTTFKQGMNAYACATASLYSKRSQTMYHIFLGGISYGYFLNGVYTTDLEVPFINQVTTVTMDKQGNFTQYIMSGEYPTIPSTSVNPGNNLLFGGAAYFVPGNVQHYNNQILGLDSIRRSTVIGYVIGGIASTVANTSSLADSFASPYVFAVTLTPTS